jgi:hypothetical protein
MKLFIKIIAGVICFIALSATILYFAFIKTVSAEVACKKTVELAKQSFKNKGIETSKMKEEDLIGETVANCIKTESKTENRGLLKVKKQRDCVMKSSTLEDFAKCSETK